MRTASPYPPKLIKQLVLDELFDLTLYKAFRKTAAGELATLLDDLIQIETGHLAFWKKFFNVTYDQLNFRRRVKLRVMIVIGWMFGESGKHLLLESIEVYGVRKYLHVWEQYKGTPLEAAVRDVLHDELKHEDETISAVLSRKVDSEGIRVIFLGFNDGLVELLGAVSGFFAALGSISAVLIAGFTVAIAGSISMAAGVFVASGSEQEVERTEQQKAKFLGLVEEGEHNHLHTIRGAFTVGVSYFLGALVPLLPVFFGSTNIYWSIVSSAVMIVVVSWILSFISGMRVGRRILINLGIIAVAVVVTYALGTFVSDIFQINI